MKRHQTIAALLASAFFLMGALSASAQDAAAPATAPVAAPTTAPAPPVEPASPPVSAPVATPVAVAPKAPPPDIVLKGDGRCTTCHDENDSPDQLKIGKTRHGVTADKRNPTCESCHGKSEEHEKKAGRGKEKAPRVDIGYTKKSNTPVEERNKACLSCHQGANRISWQSSAHATKDVACTSCHQIHTPNDKVRNKVAQAEVCYTCHKEQRAQMSRPSRHPVPEGKMSCGSCHNVHSDNPKGLVKASTNETCYDCHMEKRGPFVHNHQPVTEDCGICHNPHGTTAPTLLKQRQPLLCQGCHNSGGHRAQLVQQLTGPTNSTSALGAMARGCTNCHSNVHGGNSTGGTSPAGRFRQ